MSLQKERDVILNILDMYKDMPNLWNKNHPEYKNKTLRYDGFRVLLEVYKHIDSEATVKTIKKKIDNLKTTYFKEAKKVYASKRTGAGPEDVYVPSLWYFEALSFLGTTTPSSNFTKQPLGNFMGNENSSSSEDDRTQTESARPAKVPAKKQKKSISDRQEDLLNSAEQLMLMKEEEWEILGKSIGIQLKELNQTDLTIAQKLISDVIFYARMGKLSEDTCIVLRPSSFSSASPHYLGQTMSPYNSPSSP